MLHSILGAYTCYRPDVGYVSELFQYFIMFFSRKSQYCPAHRRCGCRVECHFLLGMESLTVNDLPQFPRREMELTWPLCGIDYILTGFDFHFLHVIFFSQR